MSDNIVLLNPGFGKKWEFSYKVVSLSRVAVAVLPLLLFYEH